MLLCISFNRIAGCLSTKDLYVTQLTNHSEFPGDVQKCGTLSLRRMGSMPFILQNNLNDKMTSFMF